MIIKQDISKDSIKIVKDSSDAKYSMDYQYERIVTSSSGSEYTTIGDAVYNIVTASEYYNGGTILLSNTNKSSTDIVDLTPSIATTDNTGAIIRVSGGVAKFAFTDNGVTKVVSVNTNIKTGSEESLVYDSVLSGSLNEHMSLSIDSRINSSMTVENNARVFTTLDHNSSTYVRNTNFWYDHEHLTCVSVWNSDNVGKTATAISPRHLLLAAHYDFGVGTIVRFVTENDEVVERTVVGYKRHPDYNNTSYYPDFTICTLDSDLPDSIHYCKVLPNDFFDYVYKSELSKTKPAAFGFDQTKKALVRDLRSDGNVTGYNRLTFSQPHIDNVRFNLYEDVVVGDSGSPVFIIVNNEPVITTVWTLGGGGSGTAIGSFIPDLNQMIVDADTQAGVSTGYTLTEVDLSMFPTI